MDDFPCDSDTVIAHGSKSTGALFIAYRFKGPIRHHTRLEGAKGYTRVIQVLPELNMVIKLFLRKTSKYVFGIPDIVGHQLQRCDLGKHGIRDQRGNPVCV